MTDTESRLRRLEERVQLLEDHLAILQLMNAYGPSVDSGNAEAVANLWTPDGVYDVDTGAMSGREQIAAMVQSRPHQAWINGGCGHLLGPPHISIDGDTAVATCYSQLLPYDQTTESFRVGRVTANRWELTRTEQGWRVTRRTNRLLDGRPEARDLLAGINSPPDAAET